MERHCGGGLRDVEMYKEVAGEERGVVEDVWKGVRNYVFGARL